MTDIPFFLQLVMAIALGLALGSFTTCVVYRVPRGLSIWRNDKSQNAYRSFCPSCKTPLAARDLIPIVSWLLLQGRCRYCRKPIGLVYLFCEIAVLIVVVTVILQAGFTLVALILCALIPVFAGFAAFLYPGSRL